MLEFEYQIVRRPRRKTASISVKPDNGVVIIVPADLPQERIEKIIRSKARWIRSKLRFNEEVQERYKPKEYVSGEAFSYLGRNYRLSILEGETQPASLKYGRINVYVPKDVQPTDRKQYIVEQLSAWYQEHALERLKSKTVRFAKQIGAVPSNVGIKSFTGRWGSCHKDGRIFFNWRIIMAPHSVVDYVVIHELCHLTHHNHSPAYWKLLESILPNYQEAKSWLKANGQTLML